MPGEFVVGSGVEQLHVWVVSPAYEWRARIDFEDLTAEHSFYERYSREKLHLDAYFADLAAHWRGWADDKEWEAQGLAFAARHDGLGHVTLDVILSSDPSLGDGWRVRASLHLDAGALDRLVREAAKLDSV
jgi:hypothetical protein